MYKQNPNQTVFLVFMKFLGVRGHLVMPMHSSFNLIMYRLYWAGLWGELNVAFHMQASQSVHSKSSIFGVFLMLIISVTQPVD